MCVAADRNNGHPASFLCIQEVLLSELTLFEATASSTGVVTLSTLSATSPAMALASFFTLITGVDVISSICKFFPYRASRHSGSLARRGSTSRAIVILANLHRLIQSVALEYSQRRHLVLPSTSATPPRMFESDIAGSSLRNSWAFGLPSQPQS